MFTLTEVASLNDIQPTYKILKPWWDVFMDYLGVVMLMLAIFAGTMQLTKDQVVCLPILEEGAEDRGSDDGHFDTHSIALDAATSLLADGRPAEVFRKFAFTSHRWGRPSPRV
ncbi:hypothetical protein NHX12_033063 [Muraenolepis orangiensis]|uniref:LRRC8 pannexin-like TM region domain-containing protein n=1 Tax=Muraenolepis orangiensis TaxID=630683 RepID=A0A9Q0E1Y6_9TELE|nr:hypothetical protein NHX12_033063 [Muraenolepis orangiensis]